MVVLSLVAVALLVTAVCYMTFFSRRIPQPVLLSETGQAVRLPLHYDENGVFVTDIRLLGQTVSVVVDTGSSHLVVGTYRCRGCKDDDRGFIAAANMPSSDSAIIVNDNIYYGSQQDVCDWHKIEVQIGESRVELPVALVTDRSGTSNYSIMGVGYNFSSFYRRSGLQLLGAFHEKLLTFSANNSRGELMIGGGPQDHPTPQILLPMVDSRDTCFYSVRLYDVMFGDVSVRNSGIAPLPSRVIFDTGSNMMDMPVSLFSAFKTHIYNSLDDLHLVFRPVQQDCENQVVKISFDSSVYLWDGSHIASMVVEASPSASRDDAIVLGSLFMNQFTYTFDAGRRTVGLSHH